MIDLKFLRCWAVREKVGEELKEWIRKVRVGLVTGVIVEEEKKRVKCRCEVKGGEIISWLKDFQPHWFLLELRVPNDHWIIIEKEKVKTPFLLPNGIRVLKFRNGTLVRLLGHKLVADYLGVKKEGGKYKLIEIERFVVDIPSYITPEKLREFLALSGAPSDIVESAEHLVSSWPTIKNLSWVEGLERLKEKEERKRIKEEEIKEETEEMKMKKKTEKEKEKEREEGEGKNKKKRKINQKDDMPPFFKPGTPVPEILKYFNE